MEEQKVLILETKDQAIEAGVPAEEFDENVHLFHETTEIHEPVVVTNAGE